MNITNITDSTDKKILNLSEEGKNLLSVLVIVVPSILGLIVIIIFVFCYCCKKNRNDKNIKFKNNLQNNLKEGVKNYIIKPNKETIGNINQTAQDTLGWVNRKKSTDKDNLQQKTIQFVEFDANGEKLEIIKTPKKFSINQEVIVISNENNYNEAEEEYTRKLNKLQTAIFINNSPNESKYLVQNSVLISSRALLNQSQIENSVLHFEAINKTKLFLQYKFKNGLIKKDSEDYDENKDDINIEKFMDNYNSMKYRHTEQCDKSQHFLIEQKEINKLKGIEEENNVKNYATFNNYNSNKDNENVDLTGKVFKRKEVLNLTPLKNNIVKKRIFKNINLSKSVTGISNLNNANNLSNLKSEKIAIDFNEMNIINEENKNENTNNTYIITKDNKVLTSNMIEESITPFKEENKLNDNIFISNKNEEETNYNEISKNLKNTQM